jgi:hypothetical protein
MSSEARVCCHRSMHCTPTQCGLITTNPSPSGSATQRVCRCRSRWCTATQCGKAARQAAENNANATPTMNMTVLLLSAATGATNQRPVCRHRSINCTTTKCGHTENANGIKASILDIKGIKNEEPKPKRVCNCRSLLCTTDKCSKVPAAGAKIVGTKSRSRSRSPTPTQSLSSRSRSRSRSPIY